jgi:ketosteroid isomerase-like protein
MKRLIIACALFIPFLINAQSNAKKEVADAVEQLRKAMVDGDKAVLEKLTSDKLSYVHSSGHVDDKKEFVEKLAGGSSDFVTIDLTEQVIVISGNVAIVRHNLSAKTNDGGKPGEVSLRIMLIWQKQGKQWILLARQATKIT